MNERPLYLKKCPNCEQNWVFIDRNHWKFIPSLSALAEVIDLECPQCRRKRLRRDEP